MWSLVICPIFHILSCMIRVMKLIFRFLFIKQEYMKGLPLSHLPLQHLRFIHLGIVCELLTRVNESSLSQICEYTYWHTFPAFFSPPHSCPLACFTCICECCYRCESSFKSNWFDTRNLGGVERGSSIKNPFLSWQMQCSQRRILSITSNDCSPELMY